MTENGALPAYAELHCLSNFSFLRGASHPEELVARAHELGYSALAITDECSLRGRGARACRRQGMRPAADPRQRNPPRRRPAAGAARHRPRRLRQSVRTHHPRQAPRRERPLPSSKPAIWIRACPAASHCSCRSRRRDAGTGALARRTLSRARLDRGGTAVRRERQGAPRRTARTRRSLRPAARRRRRRAHACALAAQAAGHAHRHPPRQARSRSAARRCTRTPSAICACACRLANLYPRELLDETLRIAARCSFSLD